jgi:hypothetical protein
MANYSEHGNESLDFIKGGELHDKPRASLILKKDSVLWS